MGLGESVAVFYYLAGRAFRQEFGPLGKDLGDGGRSVGRWLMSPAGTGFAKVQRGSGGSCVFWLEGALDLAQISVLHPNHLTARVLRVVPPWLNSILFGQSSLKRWPSFSSGLAQIEFTRSDNVALTVVPVTKARVLSMCSRSKNVFKDRHFIRDTS